MRETNIFHRVADYEVPFTELFCNFMNYKIFRECILKVVLDGKQYSKNIKYEHFSTQKRLQNNCGQPDISIKNDDIEILIEIKINNTGLTENQPEGYIRHLNTISEYNLLVFLIPENYSHRCEIEKRLIKTPKEKYKIITWNQIIEEIIDHEIYDINPLFSEFFDLITSWFKPESICFSSVEVSYMFSDSIPTILEKLFNIVDTVKNATAPTCKSSKGQSKEYGLNFRKKDGGNILYFGVWYDFWKKHNKPLIYGVHKDYPQKVKDRFLNKNKIIEMENWHMAWFRQSDLGDTQNVITTIQTELEELLEE